MKLLLHTYDYFLNHRRLLWLLLAVLLLPMIWMAASLRYKEDISDFLPVDDDYKQSMAICQQLSEASRIVLIFRGAEPDVLCEAVDELAALVEDNEALDFDALQTEVDMSAYLQRLRYVHAHAPFFLRKDDYARLDSLLSPQGMRHAFERNKRILTMPGTGMLQGTITSDPLGFFPLSIGASGQYAAASSAFTSHGGYMMTADEQMAFAFYDSPYGSTESKLNAQLVKQLQMSADQLMEQLPGVQVDLLGAPVIAVENAQRIKRDSALAIALSVLLIAFILLYSFPRKRDILLIGAAVSFGWLFGMAMLSIVAGEVSVIILGIGSIIIGIVVNYPLHLLVHQRYTSSVRQTLQEVLAPLVVGNITTIGAFLALIPLKADALHDLGIFASAMLFGTILFCVFVMPHLMDAKPTPVREIALPRRLESRLLQPQYAQRRTWIIAALLVLTTIGCYFYSKSSSENLFDSNLSHINYMTDRQRADFAYFEQFQSASNQPAFLVASAKEELNERLLLWTNYTRQLDVDSVCCLLQYTAAECGFKPQMFAPFCDMLHTDFSPQAQQQTIASQLPELWPGRFDSEALNSRIAESLSENFDYLALVCSIIVFVFLCLSFRSVWLALLAFLPMAVSWIWIFGIMHVMDLHFNIVNIILASFIFGQGDDYTIFIVEGLVDEHRTGKPILPQFRQSILLSALIMLVGIGVLVFAKHPAMHSLGAVTLVGMICVVVLACSLPPLLFRLLLWIKKRI